MHVCINAKALILAAEGAEQLEGSYTAGEMRLPFSEDEDKRLVALVQKHGVPKHGGSPKGGQKVRLRSRALVSWKFLAEKFSEGGSTWGGRQCLREVPQPEPGVSNAT